MRILLIGAGGVGSAFCAIAARRTFFEACVVADYDEARARQADATLADSEAERAAAERRADEAREWIRRLYQTAQRGSVGAGAPFERRPRRAFTARGLRSERG